jgi:glycosyltransferase involved in cell wall biosynthesis
MKSQIFFSIIIPVLNEEVHLPRLLEDLSMQSFRDFEVIVVDGGSEDKTVDIACSFVSKLDKLKVVKASIKNVSYQRNLGVNKAKGEYLVFMDADNRLPEFFLEGIKYRISTTEAEIFTTWCKVASSKPADKAIGSLLNWSIEIGNLVEQQTGVGTMIGITKKGFEKIKGFDEKKHYAEDEDFIRRACKKGLRFEVFRDPRYIYSLRRFRKEGKLGVLRNYAKLQLKKMMDMPISESEYKMGGKYHVSEVEKFGIISNFQKNMKRALKKKNYMEKLNKLMDLLTEEMETKNK